MAELSHAECSELIALFRMQRYAELEQRVRMLLGLFPESGFLWKVLGGSLRMQGKAAVLALEKAVEFAPGDGEAHCNLGVAYKDAGQIEAATRCYRRALEINPLHVEAHISLGNILNDMGQLDGALAAYARAIEIRPDFAETHNNLGYALLGLGRLEEAVAAYRQALLLRPQFPQALANLGFALQNLGRLDESAASYQRAFALQPGALQHAIHAHLLLPVIPQGTDSIAVWRDRYREGLTALQALPGTLDEPARHLDSCSFYLAYHDADDRPLMEALARMFRAKTRQLNATAPHVLDWRPPTTGERRLRIGFLSEFLVGHTIGKHYKGFIHHLDRKRFEVWVLHAPKAKHDAFSAEIERLADHSIRLPAALQAQQTVVAEQKLDILFYPDIGMSPATYFLAHARLAPVQVTSWGHPDTSGLDTIDYYLSSALSEPEGAALHYSERLVRLSRLPCFYYRSPAGDPSGATRESLGLPVGRTLYGCPQNLFKLHPDFDAVMAAIVDGDPTGRILVPEGRYPAWTQLLKERWASRFPALLHRVEFLPRMPWPQFMAAVDKMDVLLDPIHFGSGNTMYDAMASGIPVVTWPGRFARGRNVFAAYRQIGIDDAPVASTLDEYAGLAVGLGRDPDRRHALRALSREGAKQELFEDWRAVRECEIFLEAAVEAAGRGAKLPEGWMPGRPTP